MQSPAFPAYSTSPGASATLIDGVRICKQSVNMLLQAQDLGYDLGVPARVEANRPEAARQIERALAVRDVDAEAAPRRAGHVPALQRRGGDAQVPPRLLTGRVKPGSTLIAI